MASKFVHYSNFYSEHSVNDNDNMFILFYKHQANGKGIPKHERSKVL